MTKLQDLLNQEALLSNAGKKEEMKEVCVIIKLMRGSSPPPCWGEDDCSTSILLRCPWRIDCGNRESIEHNCKLKGNNVY